MLKIGITGGIGSGKSVVARIFEVFGIPVLYADDVAKNLMTDDPGLRQQIIEAFGAESYVEGVLNRTWLASQVFNNEARLKKLNSLVHPAVLSFSKQWMDKQRTPYLVKEAALFFESGSYTEMDVMVGVFAPEEFRLQRVMKRDMRSASEIRKRMANQLPEKEKMDRCNHIIYNDESRLLLPQVISLHEKLLAMAKENA